jgi:hypothetical protein
MRRTLGIVLLLAACSAQSQGAKPGVPGVPARPGDPIPAGGTATVGVKVVVPPPGKATPAGTVAGRRRGVPHFAQISAVVVDAAATRALSRDFLGQVRIWPALDGSLEPQKVPVASPEAMAITARKDGSLAALIDSAGIVTIVHFDAEGLATATATLPPDVPFSGVALLDGGERLAVVRSDQRLVLLDADGVEQAHLAVRGARVIALHAAGDRLIAILRKADGDKATFEVRALTTAGDALAWDGDGHKLPEAVAILPQVVSAVSPDGSLLGYLAQTTTDVSAKVIAIATGKAIKFDSVLAASSPTTTTIGFTDDTHLEMATLGGTGWRAVISGNDAIAMTAALDSASSAPAYAHGARVAGYQASLVVHRADGDVGYLGYRDLAPSAGALAPDGKSAAWTTSTGAIVIQRFDGSADLRIKSGNDWFSTVAVVDDDHVIAGRNNGQVVMFDSHSGAELASAVVATSSPYFVYQPTTKLLGVMRDTGTIWVVPVDAAASDPFGDPIAVSDGAASFMLLDPDLADGDALITVDGSQITHRYAAKTLGDGLTAAEIKRARGATAPYAWGYDRAGESYTLNGTSVELRQGDKLTASVSLGASTALSGVFVSPRGDQIGMLVQPGTGSTMTAVGRDGTARWSVSSRSSLYWATWSEDESAAIVLGQGGAIVVDGSTGKTVATALGRAFGLSNELPSSFPPGIDPGFD